MVGGTENQMAKYFIMTAAAATIAPVPTYCGTSSFIAVIGDSFNSLPFPLAICVRLEGPFLPTSHLPIIHSSIGGVFLPFSSLQ